MNINMTVLYPAKFGSHLRFYYVLAIFFLGFFFFRRAELVIHLKCKRGGERCRFAVKIHFISVCEEINNLVGIQKKYIEMYFIEKYKGYLENNNTDCSDIYYLCSSF